MSATTTPRFSNPLANAQCMFGAMDMGETVGEFILANIAYHSACLADCIANGDIENAKRFLESLGEDLKQAHAVELPRDLIAQAQANRTIG